MNGKTIYRSRIDHDGRSTRIDPSLKGCYVLFPKFQVRNVSFRAVFATCWNRVANEVFEARGDTNTGIQFLAFISAHHFAAHLSTQIG